MKTLALNILDIVQNSIRAEASRIDIEIRESVTDDIVEIKIDDNGKGMNEGMLARVSDPFMTTRTTRKTGLGIPLFKLHAELADGFVRVASTEGKGTSVRAVFRYTHPDRQPNGDIPGVMKVLMAANPGIDFILTTSTDSGSYSFSTIEAKEILEVTSLADNSLLNDISKMINENLLIINVSGIGY